MLAACYDRDECNWGHQEGEKKKRKSHNLERFLTRTREDENGQPGRLKGVNVPSCVRHLRKTRVLYESTLIDTPPPSIMPPSRFERKLASLGYSPTAFPHKHLSPTLFFSSVFLEVRSVSTQVSFTSLYLLSFALPLLLLC